MKAALKLGLSVPRNLLYRELLKPVPILFINHEVTRRCNSRCIYCNIWKNPSNPEHEVSPEQLKHGFRNSKELLKGVTEIGLTGGEPTLRTDLYELCQAWKEICPNASMGFPTNAWNPQKIARIAAEIKEGIDPTFHVGISLDGFEKVDTFQRGVKGHYKNAFELAELLKSLDIPVGFGSTLTKHNIGEIIEFRKYMLKLGWGHTYDVASESENYYKNKGQIPFALDQDDTETLRKLADIGRTTSYRFYLPDYLSNRRQMFPCFSGLASFFLNSYGVVYPCIHLNERLGNITKQEFSKIWLGSRAKWVRRVIRKKLCHCWTSCEAGTTVKCLVYPAIIKMITRKLS